MYIIQFNMNGRNAWVSMNHGSFQSTNIQDVVRIFYKDTKNSTLARYNGYKFRIVLILNGGETVVAQDI